jgi:hypothetical protein
MATECSKFSADAVFLNNDFAAVFVPREAASKYHRKRYAGNQQDLK